MSDLPDSQNYIALFQRGYKPKFAKGKSGVALGKEDLAMRKLYAAWLAAKDESKASITEAVGVSRTTLDQWTREEAFIAQVDRLQVHAEYDTQAHEARIQLARLEENMSQVDAMVALTKLRLGAAKAVGVLERIMLNEDENTKYRLQAATEILDRAGLVTQHDVMVNHQGNVTTTIEAEGLAEALKALGADTSYDGTVEEIHLLPSSTEENVYESK